MYMSCEGSVTWITCLVLPSDLWNFTNISAVFCELCLYVHVCEGSVTWITCLVLPSDLWNFTNISAVFCELCLYVHVCEGSVTWITCLVLPSDLWNFTNISAVFCEVCLYVHVCEGSAVAGFHLGNVCAWLWSLGSNGWFQVPGILALGGVCSWQCAGNRQCYWIPYFGSNCLSFAELCGLPHNTQQPYSNIALRQVFHTFCSLYHA